MNALKTISLRLRSYDEETQEYSEDIAKLTGEIADLTKTKSNNYGGISIFTNDAKTEYRSTYDILKDISNIWDELNDKNQADLLETLFGKHRAQVGAAILKNFESASSAIDTMKNSAGSAEAEMNNIYQSIEYRLNALRETWVGVAQSLFQSDDIKNVVAVLQTFSDVIAFATENLGLFGSVAVTVFAVNAVKAVKSVGRPKLTGFMIVPTYTLVATRNELLYSKGVLAKPTKLAVWLRVGSSRTGTERNPQGSSEMRTFREYNVGAVGYSNREGVFQINRLCGKMIRGLSPRPRKDNIFIKLQSDDAERSYMVHIWGVLLYKMNLDEYAIC